MTITFTLGWWLVPFLAAAVWMWLAWVAGETGSYAITGWIVITVFMLAARFLP